MRKASGSESWGLVWDNCKSHLVPSVRAVFAEWSIHLFEYPPNMTDLLQVVDLVHNGPIKARTKQERGRQLYEYFQQFVMDMKAYDADRQRVEKVPFRPPAPTIATFLNLVGNVFSGPFAAADFMAGVRRCFVSVGLAPSNERGDYVQYTSHDSALTKAKRFCGNVSSSQLSVVDMLADDVFGPAYDDENDGQFDGCDDWDADAVEDGSGGVDADDGNDGE